MPDESGHTPAPITKEDFGLDSNVKYRFEGRAEAAYGQVWGWSLVGIWALLALVLFSTIGALGLIAAIGCIVSWGFISNALDGLYDHQKHRAAERTVNTLDAMVGSLFASLPALRRYEIARNQQLRDEQEEQQSHAVREAIQAHEDAIRAAHDAAYAKRLARLRDLQESFEGKGTARATGKELLDMLDSNTGEDLEILVRGLFEVRGWNAKLTARGPDGGIDVVADRIEGSRRVTFAVQVKHWASNIPEKEVRDFWGACSGVYDRALFVTTSGFNKAALRFIRQRTQNERTPFSYLDGPKLLNAIDTLSNRDFDRMMVPLKDRLGRAPLKPQSDYDRKDLLLTDNAKAPFDRGEEVDPERVGIGYMEALPLSEERAIQGYDEAIRLDPQDDNAYNNRGLAYAALGQYERAIQDYDEAIEITGGYNNLHYSSRGDSYAALGQYERAIQDYDEAIDIVGNTCDYHSRGDSYAALGQYERAIQDYDYVIDEMEDLVDPGVYHSRGLVYERMGKSEEAARDSAKAKELSDAWHYSDRGDSYAALGQYERAIQDYDYVIDDDEYGLASDVYHRRGLAYEAMGQSAEAGRDFAKAKERKSERPWIL